MGRNQAVDVGLRGHCPDRQTAPAGQCPAAQSSARNPRFLLEFQGVGGSAGAAEPGYGGGPDCRLRPAPQGEPGPPLYARLPSEERFPIWSGYRPFPAINWNAYCFIFIISPNGTGFSTAKR